MRRIYFFIAAIFYLLPISSASAEVLIKCGASEGQVFFIEGPYIAKKDSGWTEDTIDSGSTSVVVVDEEFDVIFSDATGNVVSARAAGANVVLLGTNEETGSFSILTNYFGVPVEVYTYYAQTKQLFVFAQKYGAPISLSRTLVSNCS